ncbi:MAG: peptidoglycan editing factor PgeF [Pseudomonadota bacterium]
MSDLAYRGPMTHPQYITAQNLQSFANIGHAFFTRRGGVSTGIYTSLNCGLGSDDSRDNVLQNRAKVAEAISVPQSVLTVKQTHSTICAIADIPWDTDNSPEADSIVTNKSLLPIAVLTADCAPVVFADPKAGVVGIAHAGWRGALNGILLSTLERMEHLGASRKNIYAAVGPCISSQSYEVGREFYENFLQHCSQNARFFKQFQNDKTYFDLAGYITDKLEQHNITSCEIIKRCTVKNESDFYSYRRSIHKKEPDYGRHISVIWLNNALST